MNEIDTTSGRKSRHLNTTLQAWSLCVVFPSSRVPCSFCMGWDAPVRRAPCSPGRNRKSLESAFAYLMVPPSSRCWVLVITCCPKTIWKAPPVMIRLSAEFCASGFAARKKKSIFRFSKTFHKTWPCREDVFILVYMIFMVYWHQVRSPLCDLDLTGQIFILLDYMIWPDHRPGLLKSALGKIQIMKWRSCLIYP